ncbi:hypothetical protein N5C43_20720 [Comamonas terrigena]|uniref:hypothetical protein n=1 Tax=Comamonas terrigena TaxID=32013 RepID=UPI00244A60E4|nr:hypothetical protein [Comamonas terrigena]MDH1293675.1 hypothetical protein [Comamonas terrigena]
MLVRPLLSKPADLNDCSTSSQTPQASVLPSGCQPSMPPVGFWAKNLLFRKSRTAVRAKMLHVDAEAVMSWILNGHGIYPPNGFKSSVSPSLLILIKVKNQIKGMYCTSPHICMQE